MTPTGVLVSTAAPETDEWFAARREGITATDLPKILGLSKYGNALSVWLDKRGELDDEAGEAARWGQILEDPVASEWALRNDVTCERVGVLANSEHPWRRASLDRLVTGCLTDGTCGVEIKTRSAFVAGRWDDDVPDDVLAQTQWQLLVTGLPHMHVACLLGGQRLVDFTVEPDEDLQALLVDEASRVWQHVQDGTPPKVDPDALLAKLLDQLYSHRKGVRQVDESIARWRMAEYDDAGFSEKQAKEKRQVARAALIELLGDGEIAVIDDMPVYTYKANKSGVRSLRISRTRTGEEAA